MLHGPSVTLLYSNESVPWMIECCKDREDVHSVHRDSAIMEQEPDIPELPIARTDLSSVTEFVCQCVDLE